LSLIIQLFFSAIFILLISSIISLCFRGKTSVLISSILSAFSCLLIVLGSLLVLVKNTVVMMNIPLRYMVPGLNSLFGEFSICIDSLSGFFSLIIGLVGFVASIYGYKYMITLYESEHLGFYSFNYSMFLLSMCLTVIVSDLFWFIVFWELMTLSSQFLVSFEKEKKQAVWAGYKYFVITKAGAELLIIGSLIAIIHYSGMNTSYLAIRLNPYDPISVLLLSLFFTGLSIKAALVPFHTWLPDAHPEAPSHVSALLSGVMIKVPVYMMMRTFYMFTKPTIYWGLIIATIGAVTLFVGTLYALMQTDSKRLLAYHSVGQMGYIILALGASIYLFAEKEYALGIIALFASLYHLINHSLFKSTLFLTAGSVIYATGSRDLNKLGGLSKYMPLTSLSALIASLSISGIPPFNGFISKWAIYCSSFMSGGIILFYGIIAMFISGVTTASFVKYYTTIFSRPANRLPRNNQPAKIPISMDVPQLLLASLCVLFGILPIIPYRLIKGILIDITMSYKVPQDTNIINIGLGFVSFNGIGTNYPLLIAILLISISSAIYALTITKKEIKYDTWTCGTFIEARKIHYPAKSYYSDFEEAFHYFYNTCNALYTVFVKKIPAKILTSCKKLSEVIEEGAHMCLIGLAILILIIILLMV